MPNLYALLTGINQYHPQSDANVSHLNGCVNDITQLQAFLESHFPADGRNLVTLLNSDATYENVVHHFGDELLLRAGKGDVVLFAYCGHGSQEPAAKEFAPYYPSGIEETLVLYDSRTPGGLDLADKELALLVERVALTGAHVVVLLDCCHSGSGTRGKDFTLAAARQTSSRNDPRDLETYLRGAYRKRQNFYLPNSRHILLAACDRIEKAYELSIQRGLFSTTLMQVLEETGGRISYADLYTRSRTAMLQMTGLQHPQFETYGYFNGYDGFLGLNAAAAGAPVRIFFDKNSWQVNMGAQHRLPMNSDNPATFEVIKNGVVLGQARSSFIGMENSSVVPHNCSFKDGEQYDGRLLSLQAPKTNYLLKGDPVEIEAVKNALAAFNPTWFDLREDALHASICMEISHQQIQLIRRADGRPLRTIRGDMPEKMLPDAFEKLERIARWENTLDLDNKNSKISRDDIELIFVELDSNNAEISRTSAPEITLDILQLNGREQPRPFRIEIRNKHDQKTKHCALFYAGDNYSFTPVGFNEPVLPQTTAVAMDKNHEGEQFAFHLKGKKMSVDILKLFVSNHKISGAGLQQKGFIIGETVDYLRKDTSAMRGATENLKSRGLNLYDEDGEEEDINDWYTVKVTVRSVAKMAG